MKVELAAKIAELVNRHVGAPAPAGEDDGSAKTVTAEEVLELGTWVPASAHVEMATLLKENGYAMYVTVVGSHWPTEKPSRANPNPPPEHFQVATVLRDPQRGASTTFGWRVRLEPGQAIDSLVPLFAGADWQEREQYDLVGIVFRGHPDLRRLMMPEDWPGHPLRKDYAIDTAHFPWR